MGQSTPSSLLPSTRRLDTGRAPKLYRLGHARAPHPGLRELRRDRLGAGLLRSGRERGGGGRPHGRGLGARDQTTFDTADAYGGGRSETWIGRWRRAPGTTRSLTTKVFHSVEGDPDDHGLARERILRQIDGSLARLGVAQVDMYLIHAPDPATPIAETLDVLDELVRAGKVGRSAQATSTSPGSKRRRPDAVGAEPVLAARPRVGRRPPPTASSTGSASRRSARWRAAGWPESTAAARRRRPVRG